jgi:hypothetical protein
MIEDADKVLANGQRILAYDNYGYAAEAAAKSLILRLGRLPTWPTAGDPHAEEVHTHSIMALLKFAGVFQHLVDDRRVSRSLHDNWLLVKEWVPSRYSLKLPEHRDVVRFARAVKDLIAWMQHQ